MAWYPHARQRPLRFAASMPMRIPVRAVELHTNGGGKDLYDWFNRSGNNIASHFQVFADGTCEQYIDTCREAYAAFASNRYAIQIETEDDGHPELPWTAAQVAKIVAICRWTGVPAKLLADGPSDGVGWHEQYRDNNRSGHDCPGKMRVAQIHHEIIPALARPVAKPTPPREPKPSAPKISWLRFLATLRRWMKSHGK